ncbi:MAG: DUF748 domain-containing protein [Magnetococcales bacterium]|nr:DUF748 domain-containing protein [Magnetococcales bacterium]
MSNRRSLLISIFLLVVVFGLAVIVYYQTKNMDWYRPRITDVLQRITGHSVSIKQVSYSPMSGLFTLELQELEVLSQDPDEPPMMHVQETLLSFSPISLFSGIPQLSTIKFINPQINLVLRDKAPLMERAQDTAMASDKKLLKELGVGLSELTIKRITVQNGILVVLDWDHPEGRTWVFDHLHLGLHALSPMRASPVAASARYRSIPFTVNGQVGPLPDTLDPFAMPILLSLEAKSVILKELQEILSTDTIGVKTSRGYLTTLLHGSLNEGLQTSTWLQLDGLVLSRNEVQKVEEQPPQSLKNSILDRLTPNSDIDTLDLAFRQKSTLHMGWYGIPKLEFEEFFVYMDGTPILEAKGWINNQWRGPLELDVNILNQVDLERLPFPSDFYLKGVSPAGSFKLNGTWPSKMSYNADLDLTKTDIEMASFKKIADTPLAVKFAVSQAGEQITINDLVVSHPNNTNNQVTISGSLAPALQLKTATNWAIQDVFNYFPVAKNWKSSGLMQLNMDIAKSSKSAAWQANGLLNVAKGLIGDLEINELSLPFAVKNSQLNVTPLKVIVADGQVDIMGLIDLSQEPILYESQITATGVDVTKLPKQQTGGTSVVQLEGYLFAAGTIYGKLDNKTFLPTGSIFGNGHIIVEPGSFRGVDHNAFYRQKTNEAIIFNENKALYWNRMEVDITLLNEIFNLDDILVDSSQTQISGKGSWDLAGKGQLDLDVKTDFDKKQGYKKSFAVKVTDKGAASGLSMEPKSP